MKQVEKEDMLMNVVRNLFGEDVNLSDEQVESIVERMTGYTIPEFARDYM